MEVTKNHHAREYRDFRAILEENYKRSSIIRISVGSSVPLIKDHLWLVIRGIVRLGSITIHGDELLLGLAGPNEIFGDSLTGIDPFEVCTLTDCDLLCLSLSDLRQDTRIAQALIGAIMHRQRQSQAMLALLGLKRVEDRVRGFLELLATDYGNLCEDGLRISARITHQDIANAVGTTRVTVTRIIGQLKGSGWLSMDTNRFLIVAACPKK